MKRIAALFLIVVFISMNNNINSLAKELKSNTLVNGLDKNFIQIDGEKLQSYSTNDSSLFYLPFSYPEVAGYYKVIIPCFKIKFDRVNKKIKVDQLANEYFSDDIKHEKYLDIKIFNKDFNKKLHLELKGWDYFTSGKVEKLNNFKYEYGDIIKISGKVPERQSIFGKIIGATRDYSKGLSNIEDIENLGFEITENGLKEIRNQAPIIKNAGNLKIIKNSNFDVLKDITVIDDLDGDITKKLVIEGKVDSATLGEYFIKYKVNDSWNKKSEVTRKITVIENPKLNENIIKVNGEFTPLGEERFNIQFDDLKKLIKVKAYDDEIKDISSTGIKFKFNLKLGRKFKNKKYFSIEILNKRKDRKLFIELNGDDDVTSHKLNSLKDFNYEYGDVIKLWHRKPNILEIQGNVINAKEDYTDGIQNGIENILFEITEDGLKVIENKGPVINGIKDITIKKGEIFNKLKDITVMDDFDGDITNTLIVEGDVDENKVGEYFIKYKVQDSCNKISEITRKIKVIEKPKLENNYIIVKGMKTSIPGFGEGRFQLGFDEREKKIKIYGILEDIFNNKYSNKTYFIFKLLDKQGQEKKYLSFMGDEITSTKKLLKLHEFSYNYGDKIKLWHAEPERLDIEGEVIDARIDYSKRKWFDINGVEFEITKNGLKAIYNEVLLKSEKIDFGIKESKTINSDGSKKEETKVFLEGSIKPWNQDSIIKENIAQLSVTVPTKMIFKVATNLKNNGDKGKFISPQYKITNNGKEKDIEVTLESVKKVSDGGLRLNSINNNNKDVEIELKLQLVDEDNLSGNIVNLKETDNLVQYLGIIGKGESKILKLLSSNWELPTKVLGNNIEKVECSHELILGFSLK